jgi:acyl carrier protein
MSNDPMLSLFRKLATDIVERDFSHVVAGSPIAELGIDSLGMLEIVGSMERELGVQIPDEDLSGVQTVADLIALVEAQRVATQSV